MKTISVRFDANGSGADTWQYKDLFVRLTLADDTAPTIIDRDIVTTALPYKNTPATISLPFSEIVVVSGKPTITTSWGTFTYEAGSGSNVLAFSGKITARPGTALTVTGLNGTVTDLVGNAFTWSGTLTGVQVLGHSLLNELEMDSQGRYIISSKYDFYSLAAIVNDDGEDCSGKTFIVTKDIVFNKDFVPVGTKAIPFRGTFDGDGHVISGIICSGNNYQGLFGYLDEGTVQNVILRDCSFTGNDYVGGIAGYNNKGTVSDCIVESTVTIKAGANKSDCHGGVVGYLFNGQVTGCCCAASLTYNGYANCQYDGNIMGPP